MYCALILLIYAGVILIAFRIIQKNKNAVCTSKRKLNGRTCIVTGGTAGMGLEVAKDFASRGARVIIACPFEEEGANAQKTIINEASNKNVVFKPLDLASLKSTREFAEYILKNEDRLDILVNNAGVGAMNVLTRDNLNMTMQVNYYGHFLLTLLLLPLLKRSGTPEEKSRIVNVGSLQHYFGEFQDEKMNSVDTRIWKYYPNSKFCLLLFTLKLTEKLKSSNLVVNSVDPGLVGTDIHRWNTGRLGGYLVSWIASIFFKNPWEGAQNTIYAAIHEDVEDTSGKYFRNCKEVRAKKSAYDTKIADKLWVHSLKAVQLKDVDI